MNLKICEEKCDIDAIQVYRCGEVDVKLIDKKHTDRFDLKCQHYIRHNNKRKLNPKIKYKPLDDKHYHSSILFIGDKRTKWCKVSKSCPYYAEHLIYDEN